MYYDPLLFHMIPGIFMVSNKKKYESYNLIFLYIKNYILKLIKNQVINICCETYTTDFVISLYTAFKKTLNLLKIYNIMDVISIF